MQFEFVSKVNDCGIVFYDKNGKELRREPFAKEERTGNVYRKEINKLHEETYYLFYEENTLVPDVHARAYASCKQYGNKRTVFDHMGAIRQNVFDWGEDQYPNIGDEEMLVYCLHARGFTAHVSSKVKAKGTFLGIEEKITYLKSIGITTLLLQPVTEFDEVHPVKDIPNNYWGYIQGYYYAPKAAYSYHEDTVSELKHLIKTLHQNRLEVILQFYFPETVKRNEIINILRFWRSEYHIDGFYLMGNNIPVYLIAEDDFLAGSKLFVTDESMCMSQNSNTTDIYLCNDNYMKSARRFVKGDENTLNEAVHYLRKQTMDYHSVNYISSYNTLTAMDYVSYDRKHNEINGEENRDGNELTFSWNCGEEGATKKRNVQKLRIKQWKNIMSFLMLSKAIPMIFMGDEFGNSQQGNNNPWCQDNEISWLNWQDEKKNRNLTDFWKYLVAFRNNHMLISNSILGYSHGATKCGLPELSYHGEFAWRAQLENYQRQIGVMLCGTNAYEKNEYIYIAMNMHWETHKLSLPRLPKNINWEIDFFTDESYQYEDCCITVPPRSIIVLTNKENPKEK